MSSANAFNFCQSENLSFGKVFPDKCSSNGESLDPDFNPFPNNKFWTLPNKKILQTTISNFKFDENGRKFSKRLENTVGKGEIACYEQFLLFP